MSRDADSSKKLPAGKLPAELLQTLLHRYAVSDPRVITGPGIGRDAAALQMENKILVAKTDPITFTTSDIGWYATHVNANDIACMGGEPKWFLVTLLLPEAATDRRLVEEIFRDLALACKKIGVSLIGGHTEITPGLDRPIVVGAMLGEAEREDLLDISYCQPGDRIVLAAGIAIEAVSIIAREKEAELLQIYDQEFVQRCQQFNRKPGISVLRAARAARRAVPLRAMHDPTEGGLATALHEVADASGCGFVVEESLIPMFPEAKLLCDHYNMDILGAIASGALLIIVEEGHRHDLLQHFHEIRLPAADIGYLTRDGAERVIQREGKRMPLPRYDQDEIVKLFGG